jgi:hypothetical protein
MHQISLLGGLGNHVLRPDRVYKTGVLSPMVGFRPGEAVMATADAFTKGPYTGMQLSGLRGLRGLAESIGAWWDNVKARAQAGRAAYSAPAPSIPAPTAAQPTVHTPQGNAYGYYAQHPTFEQHQIAPMAAYGEVGPMAWLPGALVSRAYGQSPSLPAYAAEAASKTTMMRWRGVRWPWG